MTSLFCSPGPVLVFLANLVLSPCLPGPSFFAWFAYFAVPLGQSISALFVSLRLTSCLHGDHLTHWNQWVPPATLRPRHRNGARNSFRLGLPDCRSSSLLSRLPFGSPALGLAALCDLGVNHSPPFFIPKHPKKPRPPLNQFDLNNLQI